MGEVTTRRQRTGPGEIVPRAYEQQTARLDFFDAFWDLLPEAYDALWTQDVAQAALMSLLDEEPFCEMVRGWQSAHRLTEPWMRDFILQEYVAVSLNEGRELFDPQRPYQIRVSRRLGGACGPRGYPIVLLDLAEYHEYEDGHESDNESDYIGVFDPSAETKDQAAARILQELERRVLGILNEIEVEDTSIIGAVRVRVLPPRRHFEWTVRYQALGESYGKIAASDGVQETRTVSQAVRSVAALIGLTLRERDKGGRPRKQTQMRKARCIAIGPTKKTPASSNEQVP